MHCKHCGAEVPSDSQVCVTCGQKITDLPTIAAESVEPKRHYLVKAACAVGLLVLLLLVLAGVQMLIPDAPPSTAVNLEIDKITQAPQEIPGFYASFTDRTYVNPRLGFSVQVPVTWTRYSVWEEKVGDMYHIHFALPLEGNILIQSLDEPQRTARVLNVGVISVETIAAYEASVSECSESDGPCFSGTELGRTASHVYVEDVGGSGGWDYCAAAGGTEPYLCAVHKDAWLTAEDQSIFEKTFRLLQ